MSSDLYLHELPDFSDLVNVVAKERRIVGQLVEKDYWIMHCLYGLTRIGLTFELKGGTSLSKGYGIIYRFSEDIDIRIEPPVEMQVRFGKNHTKPIHIESRRIFYDWLATEKIIIPGIESVRRDHSFDNERLFSAGIRLEYPSAFATIDALKSGVLLEVGFDATAPNEMITVSSWVFEKAAEVGIPFFDNRAVNVRCYAPGYTFVEKLQTISTKFRQQQERSDFPANFLRHYYDIYCLLGTGEIQSFIGTAEYAAHKQKRFPKADNLCIAENEAFRLQNPDVFALYQAEYKKTEGLYYNGVVQFEEILKRIGENIDRL